MAPEEPGLRSKSAREQRNQAGEAQGTRLGRVPRGTSLSDNVEKLTELIGLSKNPLAET